MTGALAVMASALLYSDGAKAIRFPGIHGRGFPNESGLAEGATIKYNNSSTAKTIRVAISMNHWNQWTFYARMRGNLVSSTGCKGRWFDDYNSGIDTNLISVSGPDFTTQTLGSIPNVNNGSILIECTLAPLQNNLNGAIMWVAAD
jgi:hypothetical protein